MKNRIVAVLLLLVICCAIPVSASDDHPLLVDQAEVLSSEEAIRVEKALQEVSDRYHVDVVVVTVESLGGLSAMAYADDYFDYMGYGVGPDRDGILLLISMEYNDWCISTSGLCLDRFDDAGLDQVEEAILPNLRVRDFEGAFLSYANACDEVMDFDIVTNLLIAVAIGLVTALIVTAVFKSQLKSVRSQSGAANYMKPGSMNVSRANDIYLYKNVSRRPKPQNNGSGGGSHRSSSGRSHGGRGGKF
jgi:uncharacterized protein